MKYAMTIIIQIQETEINGKKKKIFLVCFFFFFYVVI